MFQKFVGFAMIAANLLVGSASAAKPERLEAIRQAIFAIHPDSNFRDDEFAEGDLDGDGVVDVAYLVHDADGSIRLGALRGLHGDKFTSWEISKLSTQVSHSRGIDIRKQSIYISSYISFPWLNSSTHWAVQFQFRNNGFVLIGDESNTSAPLFDDVSSAKESHEISTNYLTRKRITTSIKNKNKTVKTETLPADRKLTRLRDYGDL